MGYMSENFDAKHSCQSCQAPVYRVLTIHGKATVVDTEPNDREGTLRLAQGVTTLCAYFVTTMDRPEHLARGGRLYVSHFATCPHAQQWRRK